MAVRGGGAPRWAAFAFWVIAGDEGVKPKTREALAAIQASQIPFIIAINKMDKSGANAERVKQELAEENVLVEGYGGTIPAVAVSAKTGAGVDELVELILLSGELAGLNSAGGDAETATTGFVLEARLDPQIGVVATLIIKTGQLRVGDWLVVEKKEKGEKGGGGLPGALVSGFPRQSRPRRFGIRREAAPAGPHF